MTEKAPVYDFDTSLLLQGLSSGRYKEDIHTEEQGATMDLFTEQQKNNLRILKAGMKSGYFYDPRLDYREPVPFRPSQDGFFLDVLPRSYDSEISRDRRNTIERELSKHPELAPTGQIYPSLPEKEGPIQRLIHVVHDIFVKD